MNWAQFMETPKLPEGYSQGYFRYYKTNGTYDEIVAISGQLYKNNVLLPITGLSSFQDTEQIEAVQYAGTLYIATGTKLVQYSTNEFNIGVCKVVDPYLPTTQEMTYIGTNALAADPEGHLQDTIGLVPSIDYVYPTKSRGMVNTFIELKVFTTKISGESYEYATQIQKTTATSDFPDPVTGSYKALSAGNIRYAPKAPTAGDYVIRVSMRKVGTTTVLAQYDLEYTVDKVMDLSKYKVAQPTIHQCTRATVYWNRLVLYGDKDNPSVVYISQVNTPNYMPSLLTLDFENPRREPLTQLLPYRNGLLAFTKTSTQLLTGSSPEDYFRRVLHTDLGCISPKGAAVLKNHVAFLSMQGIYVLKTSSTTDDKATVEKIDGKVANLVPLDTKAISLFHDGQYQIVFPSQKMRLRFYQDLGAWTRDTSDKFDFTNMWSIDNTIHAQRGNMVYQFDPDVYMDDYEIYTNSFESKAFSLGQPYHRKKLKELQLLAAPKGQRMSSSLQVFADEIIVEGGEHSYASVNEQGEAVWNVELEPNLIGTSSTTLGDWQLGQSSFGETNYVKKEFNLTGKCLRTKVKLINEEPKENHIIGFAYVFKAKKP